MRTEINITSLEKELKKRLRYPYSWGRKQSDEWDSKSRMIYHTPDFELLLQNIQSFDPLLFNYTLNRWLNFWSAIGVEYIFNRHSSVCQNINPYNKLEDFKIDGISFDHKTSIFPRNFTKGFLYAKKNKSILAQWLYENQSQEGRKHLKNRLFIVLYNSTSPNESWKLKAELSLIRTQIESYLSDFSEEKLIKLSLYQEKILTDIIWVVI